jgi:crotonobetainyl-CoA:carnitine CoA-transferase CaiB-like acyl-CoA transferase
MANPPLKGVRVIELARILAGPWAGQMLADLGADVIKVENPDGGDDTRKWGPPFVEGKEGENLSAAYYHACNRGKRSIAIDFSTPEGADKVRRLAANADVLIENFKLGGLRKYGLDYESLSKVNPRLVYCSITGFGQDGPYAARAGYDFIIQGMSGLMSITGPAGGEPQKVGVALVDVICGLFATVGILAALRHRDRTGRGQLVEVDLLSALLAGLANQSTAYTLAGVIPTRLGNAHPSIAPYELFRTMDGDLVVAVGNDRQFDLLCRHIGRPELAADERFVSNSDRVRNRAELRALLEQAFSVCPAAEWADRLMELGIPAGQVNDIGAAFALADRLGLEPIVEVARSDGSVERLPRNPIRMSETPPRYHRAAPELDSVDA